MLPSLSGILTEATSIKTFLVVFFLNLYYTFIIYDRWKNNEQRAKSNEQRAESKEQWAKNNEQQVKSNETRVKSNEQ